MSDSLHSRLLDRIDDLEAAWHLAAAAGDPDELDAALYDDVPLGEAVRAAVELHRLDFCSDGVCGEPLAHRICTGCRSHIKPTPWPCSTISAVAAALGVELDDQ